MVVTLEELVEMRQRLTEIFYNVEGPEGVFSFLTEIRSFLVYLSGVDDAITIEEEAFFAMILDLNYSEMKALQEAGLSDETINSINRDLREIYIYNAGAGNINCDALTKSLKNDVDVKSSGVKSFLNFVSPPYHLVSLVAAGVDDFAKLYVGFFGHLGGMFISIDGLDAKEIKPFEEIIDHMTEFLNLNGINFPE